MSSSPSDAKPSESNSKQKLNKSFALLKTHAARVANVTLQWQELEDHFRKISSLIDTSFQQLQNISAADNGNRFIASDRNKDGTADDGPSAEGTPNSPPGLTGIPVTDGTSLMLFVKSHRCEKEMLRAGLRNALKRLENSGKLVLESLRAYPGVGSKFSIFRKCCVIVLEAFMKVGANVGAQEKEEAMELALKWKAVIKTGTGCWGILGFLMILAGFGLVGNFDTDEIFQLFDDIVKLKDAPELLKALGFVDRVPDLIERIISENKRLIAINYIYAFELVDKFPPVPLLKDHAKRAKEATESMLKDRTSSVKDQHMAVNREIVALKAIRVIVQSRELFSEYPVTGLKVRLEKLLNNGKELHAAELSDSKHQGKKRGRRKKGNDSSKKAKLTTTHPSHLYPQTSASRALVLNAPEVAPFTVPPENPSYNPQSASMFADDVARNMTSSAPVDSERAAHYYFVGEVSTITGTQPFPHQPPDPMSNQVGASHFEYNRIGTPTRFSPHTYSALSDSKHQGKKRGRRKKGDDSSKKAKLTTTHPNHMYPRTSAPRVMALDAPEIASFTVPPENPSYPQSASMFADHSARNMTSSARVDSERAAHNYFVGEVSTITGTQPFPHQPPDLMSNQVGASHFGYNRIGTPTRFSPHMNSAVVGRYSSLDSAPSYSHGHYSLSGERNNVATNSKEHREGPQVYNAPSSYFCNIPEGPRYYTGPAIPPNVGNAPSLSNSLPSFYHHPGTSGRYGARYGTSPSHPPFTHHL